MSRWKCVCGCREVDLLSVCVQRTHIASSSAFVAQRLSNLLLLSLLFPLRLSPSRSILPRSFVEGVTMYSWLVTVLLLASGVNSSGGQSAGGGIGGEGEGEGVYQLVCFRFSPQVHKCPSQATHVRNLT